MPRPRFQFRLSTLLWITLAVACWFGGMAFKGWLVEREAAEIMDRQRLETLDKFDDPNTYLSPDQFLPD